MSYGKLTVKQSFGLSPHSKSCLSFCEGSQLAYVSGHHVAIINTETKDQTFVSLGSSSGGNSFKSQGISAIAYNNPKKILMVAEKSEPIATLTVYDSHTLRKKRTLNHPEIGSAVVKSISFSDDGKFCITQGGAPEWNLILWNVEKNPKIVTMVKTTVTDDNPVHQVSFCPWDATTVAVFGRNVFRIYRIVDAQFRQYSSSLRRDHFNALSHCWVSDAQGGGSGDNLLVGTEAGEIILFQSCEFRAVVYPTGNEPENEVLPVLSLAPSNRGFIAGLYDGEIRVFETQVDAREQYTLEAKHFLPVGSGGASRSTGSSTSTGAFGRGHVVSMTAGGSDDSLVLATDTNQLLYVAISALYNNAKDSNNNNGGNASNGTGPHFENLLTSFHVPNSRGEGAINGIDVALWRPIVATCGKDCTVRIWNPQDKKVELVKHYDDEPNSVSIHPSGLYLAVAFNDKIKLLTVLQDTLAIAHDISVRACTYVKFSKGGHFVAAICGSSVQIHNTFTGTMITSLRGHTNKIRMLVWMNYDSKMMTVGAEGSVYYWDIFPNPIRRPEVFTSPIPFHSGFTTPDLSRAFVSSTDRQLKEIFFRRSIDPLTGLEGSIQDPKDIPIGFVCNSMTMNDTLKLLVMGSSDDDQPGSIITTLAYPTLSSNFEVNPIHAGPITAMCVSHDGLLVYSADAHGTICISEFDSHVSASSGKGGQGNAVATGNAGATGKAREGIASFEFVDEVLIRKSELESKKALIGDLSGRVEELTLNNEHQLRLKEMDHSDKIREISNKFSGQLTVEREKLEELQREKSEMERGLKTKMKVLQDKQGLELKDIHSKYQVKLNSESNRYKSLSADIEDIHRRWNEDNRALVDSHQLYLKEVTEDFEDRLNDEQQAQIKLQTEKEEVKATTEENRVFTEQDGDLEIEDMKVRYEGRLKNEQELGVELMAQHALLKKNLQMLTKDCDQQKDDIKRIKEKEARLVETIKSLEKDIQSHKKEIREREETITEKEKRIFDLKKKNQELEKFRFVLDYKIKELKLQIAPRESEIATMKKQIEDMGLELEQYHKSNQALNLMIEELKLKLDGLRKEHESQCERVALNHNLIDKIRRDLQEVAESLEGPALLKSKVVKLYQVYVQEDIDQSMKANGNRGGDAAAGASKGTGDVDPQEAYNRDREQTERSLDALRRAIKTDAVAHKRDHAKMVRENVVLTKELNTLRKDARGMYIQKKVIDECTAAGDYSSPALVDILGIPRSKLLANGNQNMPVPNSKDGGGTPQVLRPPSEGPAGIFSRTTALRTASATGAVTPSSGRSGHRDGTHTAGISKTANYEAWREIQIQYTQMQQLEDQVTQLCNSLGVNPIVLLSGIDASLTI